MTPADCWNRTLTRTCCGLVQGRESGADDDRIRVDVLNLVAWFHYRRANATGQPPHVRDHRIAFHFFGGYSPRGTTTSYQMASGLRWDCRPPSGGWITWRWHWYR